MKLTVKIKLNPSDEQVRLLSETIKQSNIACDYISKIAWSSGVFQRFSLHKEAYHKTRNCFHLNSQCVVGLIRKVSDAYKVSCNNEKKFKKNGSVPYDSRMFRYRDDNTVSIWTVGDRIRVPFVCNNVEYFKHAKGEAKLIQKKGKFYLIQAVDIEEPTAKEPNGFIGCDFGVSDICTMSDGTRFSSKKLREIRKKYSKIRRSVQSKGTRSSRRLLKRLSGKEHRFCSITNHTISKYVVNKAKESGTGICIEDLKHIRSNAKPKSKAQKKELHTWAFSQLKKHIEYKSKINGIKVIVVPSAYTSQTCFKCMHIGKRSGKKFNCKNCGNVMDADVNAAKNISTWGDVVNSPEKQHLMSCKTKLGACLNPIESALSSLVFYKPKKQKEEE